MLSVSCFPVVFYKGTVIVFHTISDDLHPDNYHVNHFQTLMMKAKRTTENVMHVCVCMCGYMDMHKSV